MMYWIEYTDGTKRVFDAKDKQAAYHYFYNEGDHAFDYGPVEEASIEVATLDWMTEVDPYEGQAVHRTRSGKGAVGQAIAKSKLPPNCS